jgi:type IX secretion system PorP/SprF family membrane protein
MNTNVAQIGSFEGTYRIGGLYRNQWSRGITNGYSTPIIYADFNINGFRKQDWIGIGATFYQDRAGTAQLTNTLGGLGVAYHVGLNKNSSLSFGVQASYVQRRIEENKLVTEQRLLTGQSTDVNNIVDNGVSYPDFNLGVAYTTKVGKKDRLTMGAALDHLTSPKYNLISATISTLPRRITLHGEYEASLSQNLSVIPGVIFRTAGGARELAVNALGVLKIDPKRNINLRAGAGYRLGDAGFVLAGLDFGAIRAGFAYDFTVSKLRTDSRIQDGMEFAVMYIGKIRRKTVVKPVILCPRF